MEIKIKYTPESILEKKFQRDVKGYDAFEVDSFLDEVIKDYQAYETFFDAAEKDLESYKRAYEEEKRQKEQAISDAQKMAEAKRNLEIDKVSLQNRLGGIKPGDAPTSENLQLLKRLRALEEFLYAHGYNPNEIASGIIK